MILRLSTIKNIYYLFTKKIIKKGRVSLKNKDFNFNHHLTLKYKKKQVKNLNVL